jgi:hypothetical protein
MSTHGDCQLSQLDRPSAVCQVGPEVKHGPAVPDMKGADDSSFDEIGIGGPDSRGSGDTPERDKCVANQRFGAASTKG